MSGVTPPFAELHALSNFSFLRGASHPEELIMQAAELGYEALALTDECSVAGVVRAWQRKRQQQLSIRLIVGSEFRRDDLHLIVLASNREGYAQLCRLITRCRRRAPKGSYQLLDEDLTPEALPDCLALWYPAGSTETGQDRAAWLAAVFPDRLWIALRHHLSAGDDARCRQARQLAAVSGLPLVCANDVHMHTPERQMLQDTLTAIRHGCTVQTAGYHLFPNAERHLRSMERLHSLYGEALLTESVRIARRCTFELDSLSYEYPSELVPPGMSAADYLRQLTREGEQRRYPRGTPLPVQATLRKELQLITDLGYEHFFLTIEDLVRFARNRGILCQGRGSAANSAVCYCLGITEVDPTKATLLFERFVSKERNEPPDIDVDFEHERREEVMQYIYVKYGRHRAALAATVITYRAKSAIRDVGKALGYPTTDLDRLIDGLDRRDRDNPWYDQLQQQCQSREDRLAARFARLVGEIRHFPRHLSQHVGGFVIAADNLDRLVPTENAAMAERTVIQWDKDDLEALGLLKVDVLALGMLTAIRKCLQSLQQFHGRPFRVEDIPPDDPATYRMLQQADSVGVFQVESRAQMSMLPRLRPKTFYDLVVQIAIVRPGPIQGDMVHPYLTHRQDPDSVTYPNEAIRKVLERTYGVPIFQEQVIALAMAAAGFSPGEADQLRRAMASWKRHGHMEELQSRLIQGMLDNGHSADFADRLCRQIQGFGEYGFPESHAASFALLAYVSAWLKCHHPAAFCCALLNSQPMGFYSPSQLLQDLRRHDVTLLPVDINRSHWDHSLEPDPEQSSTPALRLGFRQVKGVNRERLQAVLSARPEGGFADLLGIRRLNLLHRSDWAALASADALSALAGHRYQVRWDVMGQVESTPLLQSELFGEEPLSLTAPAEGESILEDYHSLGLTLGRHPLALLRERGHLPGVLTADSLQDEGLSPPCAVTVCGLVTGRQRPGSASGVTFVTLEDETGNVNVVVWLDLARRQRQVLLASHLLRVRGKLEREGDVIHVIAHHLDNCSAWLSELKVKSRDFH
ncbi:DNA polymerase III subunit alpha [Natronospirillum operosum]|uniref:Error-prone DNA polymerase n=1 Tax=Natronospirillum operosum TaxID=2759953 RepID=A0A4Z0WH23_9GAMM|nr:error-prone DNA polymerase [Natronospirillum operosum]TGG95848.1 DNA polymerase III subunit alpha [Natronospirillum operosum]